MALVPRISKDSNSMISGGIHAIKDGRDYIVIPDENGEFQYFEIVSDTAKENVNNSDESSMTFVSDFSSDRNFSTATAATSTVSPAHPSTSKISKPTPIWTGKKDKTQTTVDKQATIDFLGKVKSSFFCYKSNSLHTIILINIYFQALSRISGLSFAMTKPKRRKCGRRLRMSWW